MFNKRDLLKLVDQLELPKTEYYILSSGSLLLYGLREFAGDLDLCVSNEIFVKLKEKYNLSEKDRNAGGFYHITHDIEIIPKEKKDFNMEIVEGYPVQNLEEILMYKQQRNAPKDILDIENIKKYLKDKKI